MTIVAKLFLFALTIFLIALMIRYIFQKIEGGDLNGPEDNTGGDLNGPEDNTGGDLNGPEEDFQGSVDNTGGDLKGSVDNTGGDFQGRKGGAGDFTAGIYMPTREGVVTADDQDAFLAMGLAPADTVGKDHGYPVEGLMGGGYIPLPYSSIDGIVTNEDLAINI
jgi:hypothetical protein